MSPALDRPTADITARVTAMNYLFTSRPVNTVWFSARYRQYEFDNRTVPFETRNSVNYDTTIVALNKESEPFSQTRHTFDADATYSPIRHVGFRAGYTREEVDRTYRIVEKTTEDIGRASVDLTGLPWLSVRGVFEHSKRRGSPVDGLELLAIGEQPLLRQYDISDRDQDRFSTIIMVTPVSQFSVNTSVSFGRQEYPGTNFGLRNNDNQVYSLGFDYVPGDKVSMGLTYGFEKYTALQASRTANPLPANTVAFLNDPTQQFNDPRRDWTDDSADRVHTFDASIDVLKLLPRTDIKVAYDYSRAESTYTYGLAANTVDRGAAAALARDQRAAARDGRREVLPDQALRARRGVLVRQVQGGRLRAEPGQQPGAAGDGDAHADDARLLLPAIHGEHRDGTDDVPLVGTEARCFRGSPEASNLRPGERQTPPRRSQGRLLFGLAKIPPSPGNSPAPAWRHSGAIRETIGKTASIASASRLPFDRTHVVSRRCRTGRRQPQAADAARASAAHCPRRPAQRR